jgi:hypothetical protein
VTKILVLRVDEEPKVEDVLNPFNFCKQSLGLDYIEVKTLHDGVIIYHDENAGKKLRFNRDVLDIAPHLPKASFTIEFGPKRPRADPGEVGYHRLYGNFILTKNDGDGENADLTEEELHNYSAMLRLQYNAGKCRRCGKQVAYHGAIFCGAACTARYEDGA